MLPIISRGHTESGFYAHAVMSQMPQRQLERLPGNMPTREARYVCLVPVRDYHRMLRSFARDHKEWHYSDLEPEILGDVRAGRAVIMLDLCNEGPSYAPQIFDELYDWIEAEALPAGRVVWLAQNRYMAEAARLHAGMRSNLVRFEYFDFFVRVMAWLFSPYAAEPLLGRDVDAMVERLLSPATRDRLLLCLNATPRLHRVLTVAALHHNRLIDGCLVSFPGLQYVKEGASIDNVTQFVEHSPVLHYLRPDLEAVRGWENLQVDSFEEKGNALFAKIDPRPYERTFFSLVTESDFSDGTIDRVSEKIAKAFCMGHPALLVGNPASIKFMTELGFQDWDGVLDRSVETISSPAERFQAVMEDVKRQTARIVEDKIAWMNATREVSAFNLRHAMTGGMFDAYVAKYDRPLVERLQALIAG